MTDLFDYLEEEREAARHLHRTDDPPESAAAALSVIRKAERTQRFVRDALSVLGSATDQQIHEHLCRSGVSISPERARTARSENVKLGLVERAGTGRSSSGRAASCWRLTAQEVVA